MDHGLAKGGRVECRRCQPILELFDRTFDVSGSGYSAMESDSFLDATDVYTVVSYVQRLPQSRCRCLFKSVSSYYRLLRVVLDALLHMMQSRFELDAADSSDSSTLSSPSTSAQPAHQEQRSAVLAAFCESLFDGRNQLYMGWRGGGDASAAGGDVCVPDVNAGLRRLVQLAVDEADEAGGASVVELLEALLLGADAGDLPLAVARHVLGLLDALRSLIAPDYRGSLDAPVAAAAAYLLRRVDERAEVLRETAFRRLVDGVWRMGADAVDEGGELDKAAYQLAVRHLDSAFLAVRLAGLTQLNTYLRAGIVHLPVDPLTPFRDEKLAQSLTEAVVDDDLVGRIFGPNSHQELVKHSQALLEFLAQRNKLDTAEVDKVWGAAQQKDCQKQVYSLLCDTLPFLDVEVVLHIYGLLFATRPCDQTEMSLQLAFQLTDMFWVLQEYRLRPNLRSVNLNSFDTVDRMDISGGTEDSDGSGSLRRGLSMGRDCGERLFAELDDTPDSARSSRPPPLVGVAAARKRPTESVGEARSTAASKKQRLGGGEATVLLRGLVRDGRADGALESEADDESDEDEDDDDVSSDRATSASDRDDDDARAPLIRAADAVELSSPGALSSPRSHVPPLVHASTPFAGLFPSTRNCRALADDSVLYTDLPQFSYESYVDEESSLLWRLFVYEGEDALPDESKARVVKFMGLLVGKQQQHRPLILHYFVRALLRNVKTMRAAAFSLQLLAELVHSVAADTLIKQWTEEMDLVDIVLDHYLNSPVAASPQAPISPIFDIFDAVFASTRFIADFCLTHEQLDKLWRCLFERTQSAARDQFCRCLLSHLELIAETDAMATVVEFVLAEKLGGFHAQSMSMSELDLLRCLLQCSGATHEPAVRLLWSVALRNADTDVSRAAMSSVSGIDASRGLAANERGAREVLFIGLSVEHLRLACDELAAARTDEHLSHVHRAVNLLRSHLDDFRRHFSFALRRRELADPRRRAHFRQISPVDDAHAVTTFSVQIQCPAVPGKPQLQIDHRDTLGELRAEIAVWWQRRQAAAADNGAGDADSDAPPPSRQQIRILFGGRELHTNNDNLFVHAIGLREGVTLSVTINSWATKGDESGAPDDDYCPSALLLQPQNWQQLERAMNLLLAVRHDDTLDTKCRCATFAGRVWEIFLVIPTNSQFRDRLVKTCLAEHESAEAASAAWKEALGASCGRHTLTYCLQILLSQVIPHHRERFVDGGGFGALLDIVFSSAVDMDCLWNQWNVESVSTLLQAVHMCAAAAGQTDAAAPALYELNAAPWRASDADRLVDWLRRAIAQLCADSSAVEFFFWPRSACLRTVLALLVSLVLSSRDCAAVLVERDDFAQWLKAVLIDCPLPALRQECLVGLGRLIGSRSNAVANFRKQFGLRIFSNLLDLLPDAQAVPFSSAEESAVSKLKELDSAPFTTETRGPSSSAYFSLLRQLHDDLVNNGLCKDEERRRLLEVVGQLARYVAERPAFETSESAAVDHCFVGMCGCLAEFVKQAPSWKATDESAALVERLWSGLFDAESATQLRPRWQTAEARAAAFELLVELSRASTRNFGRVREALLAQHGRGDGDELYPWEYWPADERRNASGFVGIVNLGATCYMATALQHLFMLGRVRRAVLAVDAAAAVRHVDELLQLQRLFAFLQNSERRAVDPRHLCRVYRMDHQPLNPTDQKDMTEFFTDLVTKLEEVAPELKRTLRELFCGVISNNVISEDCGHVSKTTEEFYTVRCQVADIKDLLGSLDGLTAVDVLEGDNMYTCGQCNKKVKAKKRACFVKLPDVLTFNTMRYSFNMLTMMKEKVNTHFSFPQRLDMSAYMEAALLPAAVETPSPPPPQLYELIGVTVHTGTADGGHYYSFIRTAADAWHWFNDADVKAWNPANMAMDCFGGESTRHQYDSGSERFLDYSFEKTNSAYMLFYKRLPTDSAETEPTPAASQVAIPSAIQQVLVDENVKFIRHSLLFDHNYFHFVSQMATQVPPTLLDSDTAAVSLQVTELLLHFVLETLIHAKEKPNMHNFTETLIKLLHGSVEAGEWLLRRCVESRRWCVDILLRSPVPTCRQLFEKLVWQVVIQLEPAHRPLYMLAADAESLDEAKAASCVAAFFRALLHIVDQPDLDADMRQLAECLSLLLNLAQSSVEARLFLLRVGAVETLVNAYMRRVQRESLEAESDELDEDELSLWRLVTTTCHRSLWVGPSLAIMNRLIMELIKEAGADTLMRQQCRHALVGTKDFPFLMQQMRDASDVDSAGGLVLTICNHMDEAYAEPILEELFRCIVAVTKDSQATPLLNVLTHLCTEGDERLLTAVLCSFWRRVETRPCALLGWLSRNVAGTRLADMLLGRLDLLERFLLSHPNVHVRAVAAQLLANLVPSTVVRDRLHQFLLPPTRKSASARPPSVIGTDALVVLHKVYEFLLHMMQSVVKLGYQKHLNTNGRLVHYFTLLRACLLTCDEQEMMAEYVPQIWYMYSTLPTGCKMDSNKLAMLQLWFAACDGCEAVTRESVAAVTASRSTLKIFIECYTTVDRGDRELTTYNKGMTLAFASLLRLLCAASPQLCLAVAEQSHQMTWSLSHVVVAPEFRETADVLMEAMGVVCRTDGGETVRSFKRALWAAVQAVTRDTSANSFVVIQLLRCIVDSPDDKLFLLDNDVMNVLSDVFATVHDMYYKATACNVSGDMAEVLRRLHDFLQRLSQCAEVESMQNTAIRVLAAWLENAEKVTVRLLLLLNSYVPPDLRAAAIACLRIVVDLYSGEWSLVERMLALICKTHNDARQRDPLSADVGPFFPRRAPAETTSSTAPRDARLDMVVRPLVLEASWGVDGDYDGRLNDFYAPYQSLVVRVIRAAVNRLRPSLVQPVVLASALLALETLPLQSKHFSKLWGDIAERRHSVELADELFDCLYSCAVFEEYVVAVLLCDQTNLAIDCTHAFFAQLSPEVRLKGIDEVKLRQALDNVAETIKSFEQARLSKPPGKMDVHTQHLLGAIRATALLVDSSTSPQLGDAHSEQLSQIILRLQAIYTQLAGDEHERSEMQAALLNGLEKFCTDFAGVTGAEQAEQVDAL